VDIFYFDLAHALGVHDKIIEISGGLHGIKDAGQLESILEHIQTDEYYPMLEDKLTHIVFAVAKFHCFVDGNKRSAIALGAYFLELNGYDRLVSNFIREMENIVVWVVEGRIHRDMLLQLINSLCSGDDYPEEIKLNLIDVLGGMT